MVKLFIIVYPLSFHTKLFDLTIFVDDLVDLNIYVCLNYLSVCYNCLKYTN